jgi:hypothetical protein
MTRIVTMHYRYKPRKRRAAPLAGPAVVAREGSPRLGSDKTVAEVDVKPPRLPGEATQSVAQPAANDDRKPAIVTTADRKRLKLLRDEQPAAKQDEDPEATARVKAFLARMIRPGGALPPEKP